MNKGRSKLREHRAETIREQQRKALEAIAAAESKWKKRTAAILTVTLTASAIAVEAKPQEQAEYRQRHWAQERRRKD